MQLFFEVILLWLENFDFNGLGLAFYTTKFFYKLKRSLLEQWKKLQVRSLNKVIY